jgi:Holliday junction DNA helicase RuvA
MFIEKLTGTYVQSLPTGVVIECNGVGYGIEMPLAAMCELPETGSQLSLWIYSHIREDAIKLYGFIKYEERSCFELLISLNGVGPKIGLAILSTMSVAMIKRAVLGAHMASFEAVPGVGARLAERILVELKPKVNKLLVSGDSDDPSTLILSAVSGAEAGSPQDKNFDDVRSALENLGYKDKHVTVVMNKLLAREGDSSFTELMRAALLELRSPTTPAQNKEKEAKAMELF